MSVRPVRILYHNRIAFSIARNRLFLSASFPFFSCAGIRKEAQPNRLEKVQLIKCRRNRPVPAFQGLLRASQGIIRPANPSREVPRRFVFRRIGASSALPMIALHQRLPSRPFYARFSPPLLEPAGALCRKDTSRKPVICPGSRGGSP